MATQIFSKLNGYISDQDLIALDDEQVDGIAGTVANGIPVTQEVVVSKMLGDVCPTVHVELR